MISLTEVCKSRGIRILSYETVPELVDLLKLSPNCRGVATILDNQPVILCDGTRPTDELRYTIAHELGHILLGHLSFRAEHGIEPPQAEMEANAFAAALIAQDLIQTYGKRPLLHKEGVRV